MQKQNAGSPRPKRQQGGGWSSRRVPPQRILMPESCVVKVVGAATCRPCSSAENRMSVSGVGRGLELPPCSSAEDIDARELCAQGCRGGNLPPVLGKR